MVTNGDNNRMTITTNPTIKTHHYVNRLNAILHGSTNSVFQMKKCRTFVIYGPNTEFWCSLELPQ